MKKFLKSLALISAMALVFGAMFASCSDDDDDDPPSVTFTPTTKEITFEEAEIDDEMLEFITAETVRIADTSVATLEIDKTNKKFVVTSVKAGTTTIQFVYGTTADDVCRITVKADGSIEEKMLGEGEESGLPWTGTEEIMNADTFNALKAELGDGVDGKKDEYKQSEGVNTGYTNLKAIWASKENDKDLETGKSYIGFITGKTPATVEDVLIVYSEGMGNLRMRESGIINYNGDSKRYVAVDTGALASSGRVKVSFSISVNKSDGKQDVGIAWLASSATGMPENSNAMSVPSDALDSKTGLKLGSGNDSQTLEATVNAGEKVYLFFSRNGQGGGGIDVTEIKVESAE